MSVTTRLTLAAVMGTAMGLYAAGSVSAADSPVGVWIDDTGRGAVEITECGQNKLCGKLVWIQNAKNSKACGTPILGNVTKVGGGSWDGGWIYSPEKDSKYDVELTPAGSNKLTVLGYAGTKLFSKEMTWTRAPADLKRCDMVEVKPIAPKAQVEANAAPTSVPAPKPAVAPSPTGTATETAAIVRPVAKSAPAQMPAVAPKTPDQEKADAEKWASEPDAERTKTAQADVAPDAKAEKPRVKPRRKMCSVEAPFVTVDFPCDDD